MKHKHFHALLLIVAISLPATPIDALNWLSMANLQNIGTNMLAVPGTIGQILQIDKLLQSIAPSLWNSYGTREQQAITGVVTTLVGVIIGILYKQLNTTKQTVHASANTKKIVENAIESLNDLPQVVKLDLEDYQQRLIDQNILTVQELDRLNQTIDIRKQDLQDAVEPLKILGIFDNTIAESEQTAIQSIKQLEQIGLQLKALAVTADLQRFFRQVDSFKDQLGEISIQIPRMSNYQLNTAALLSIGFQEQYKEFKKDFDLFLQNENISNVKQFPNINLGITSIQENLQSIGAILDRMDELLPQ